MRAVTHRIPAPFLARVDALLAQGGRRLLGLVGPPGAGKSTLAQALQQGQVAGGVEGVGRALAAGAAQPRELDVGKVVAVHRHDLRRARESLEQRLREQRDGEIVYAPEFRREIEEPVAGAIAVLPATRLVITEGNYLLLDDGPWAGVAKLLDDCWYVEIDPALRTDRLVARHRQFGRSAEQAADWVAHTDEPNARRIEATRGRARAVFRWSDE